MGDHKYSKKLIAAQVDTALRLADNQGLAGYIADLERQRDELVEALVDINNALPSEATDRQSIDVRRIVFKSLAKAEKAE